MLLRDKSAPEAVSKFKELVKQIERESNAHIVFVRSDNDRGEFGAMFQKALLQEGVQFEPSPPYKHSLDSVIKRAIGKINAIIRSLLY
jgi:uroporphyrinogen-III synthase